MANRLTALLATCAICASIATPMFAQGLAGPYLAATRANFGSDFDAAAKYYTQAMAADAQNMFLKQNALVAFVSAGDFPVAAVIAGTMQQGDTENIYADIVVMVDLINKGDFVGAQLMMPADSNQISPLLWGLLDSWLKVGAGQVSAGLAGFDAMSENETIALFGQYHKARALAFSGDLISAAAILDGDENGPLHLNRESIIAHVQILMQLFRTEDAISVLEGAMDRGFRDAELVAMHTDITNGKAVEFTQINASAFGTSEAFLTLAEALSRDEPSRLALFYARLAQHLRVDSIDATLTVADMLEQEQQYSLAIEAYDLVPQGTILYKNAQIGRAEAERRNGDAEAATVTLLALANMFPDDVNVLNALGDIYRGLDNYADAADAYTRAIDALVEPAPSHWVLYYTRGIAFERLKNWPAAEADLRFALELSPNQPSVLNYLGYSFIEMNENLDEAQTMIETAVAGRPNDGYITDSLAWLLYRVGKFTEAVPHMERAAELLPVDPVVSDHLGDVLWMVGRKTEARFQWRRAMSFEPEEVDLIRIKRKLEVGLDVVLDEEI